MNLLSVRQKFITLSGRYDLATTVGADAHDTDAGADFFINAGMKFLDRKFQSKKSEGMIYKGVAANAWYITFQNCMAVSEVWCNDDEDRWKLTKYSLEMLKKNYAELASVVDTGSPLFYAPLSIRSIDTTDMNSLGTFLNYVKTDDYGTYDCVAFFPPADGSYVIEVIGKFYTAEMTVNTVQNYWTTMAPDTLLKAALYQLEVFYRNTEGANDWLKAIEREGMDIEFDLVEQESNEQEVVE